MALQVPPPTVSTSSTETPPPCVPLQLQGSRRHVDFVLATVSGAASAAAENIAAALKGALVGLALKYLFLVSGTYWLHNSTRIRFRGALNGSYLTAFCVP